MVDQQTEKKTEKRNAIKVR